MRNELLRDVIAGTAGVLVVLAVIGLPKDNAPAQQSVQGQVRLMPYYSHKAQQNPIPRIPRPPAPVRPAP
jgi:hypothetical protein